MLAYFICKLQFRSLFVIYSLIIEDKINLTLEDAFSGYFLSWTKSQNRYHVGFGIFNIQTLISAEYGRSTFTGVKSDTSSTQPFVIIKADSEFTSTGVVGISYPPSQLYPAGIEFTSTGVVGISCLPAIILADSEFTSTGVVGISYPPAIINGRRSTKCAFTGVKFLECSAPADNISFRKIYE